MPVLYDHITVTEATLLQKELRAKMDIADQDFTMSVVAGADISLDLYSTTIYAGIILLSFPQLLPLACSLVKAETQFPYVPGYLAFREVPALVQAWEQLPQKPDVLITDGHGIAHPRRMGIAAHFGILTGQRSMGCAKKILYGKFEEPGPDAGAASPIYGKEEQVGYAFRSKTKTLPVLVSPGYKMGLENCLQVIRQCSGKYRIPEPTRHAHNLVNKFRTGMLPEGYHLL